MGRTGIIHHFGTFLLFTATVLLVITTISSPVVNRISMLNVVLDDSGSSHPSISYGTFGYCVLDFSPGVDHCTRSAVGYDATTIIEENNADVRFADYAAASTNGLTRVMILHPVATALAFISFLLAIGAGIVGSLLAAVMSGLTFLVTLVALVCDFVAFGVIKSTVNNAGGSYAYMGSAMWTLLAALVCSFLATIIVFFTCCSARLHRRREQKRASKVEAGYAGTDGYGTAAPRRRWF